MVHYSLLAYDGRSTRHRRSLLLIIIIIIAAPLLTHADPNISTRAKTLSSSTPSTFKPDIHGVTSAVHDTLFGIKNDPIQEEGEEEGEGEEGEEGEVGEGEEERDESSTRSHSHAKSKNRMNIAMYPIKDKTPDVNSPQVQAWISEIDWTKVPKIPVAPQHPQIKSFPLCPPSGQENQADCWWSCTGCVAKTDVITCPNSNAWGLTYDDGPSLATRSMMKHLGEMKLTATFFIVGSRVLEFPDILREQVAQGHHLGMHSKEFICSRIFSSDRHCLGCFSSTHYFLFEYISSLVARRTYNINQPPNRS